MYALNKKFKLNEGVDFFELDEDIIESIKENKSLQKLFDFYVVESKVFDDEQKIPLKISEQRIDIDWEHVDNHWDFLDRYGSYYDQIKIKGKRIKVCPNCETKVIIKKKSKYYQAICPNCDLRGSKSDDVVEAIEKYNRLIFKKEKIK